MMHDGLDENITEKVLDASSPSVSPLPPLAPFYMSDLARLQFKFAGSWVKHDFAHACQYAAL